MTSKPSTPRKATWSAHSAGCERAGSQCVARRSSHKTSHWPLCFVFWSTWSPKLTQPLRRTWLQSLTHTAPQRQSNNKKHQTATDSFVLHANPTSGSCHIFFKSHAQFLTTAIPYSPPHSHRYSSFPFVLAAFVDH